MLGGHISNWEMVAFSGSFLSDIKLNVIVKVQSNDSLNKKVNEYREMYGNKVVETGYSLREIFGIISRKEVLGFLIDQSAPPDQSVYVDFFGKKVASFGGPAKLALRFKPDMFMIYNRRDADYKYTITIEKFDYDDIDPATDDAVFILTSRMQKRIEEIIREDPRQWFWLHKRFKRIKE